MCVLFVVGLCVWRLNKRCVGFFRFLVILFNVFEYLVFRDSLNSVGGGILDK